MPWRIITFFLLFISYSLGKQGFGPGNQEWGYVTVRPEAHMFWWLYHTTADVNFRYEEKPLIIWLQGGPGASGTAFGNFEEIGLLDTDMNLRNHSWVKDYNVMFIDNPVGTGFSYVESKNLLSKNNEQIAKDLMICIEEFYKKFPEFSKTPTFILTESYGGKMTVEFAHLWHQKQKEGNIKSNFKGIGLVDSLISPNDVYKAVAPYLFNFGMIDSDGYKMIDGAADRFVNASDSGDWMEVINLLGEIENLIQKYTYNVDRFNVINKMEPIYYPTRRSFELSPFIYSDKLKSIMKQVKKDLNLKSNWGTQESAVYQALLKDCLKPVAHYGTLSWIEKLNWKHADKWLKAPRFPLVVDNIIEGYSKGFGKLKFYWVNRSGHMIPADNPTAMAPILKDLIYN